MWTAPLPAGSYTLGAKYGESGPRWASGHHTGLDFVAPSGTAVLAVDDGVVTSVGYSGPYGNLVKVRHAGVDSWYAHLSGFNVRTLQRVSRGQQLGRVGETGNTTGPHLHLEARVAGNHVDPQRYLSGQAAPNVPGGSATAGVQPVSSNVPVLGPLIDAIRFFTDPQMWIRVAEFAGGVIAILLAIALLARKGVGEVVSEVTS